MVWIKCLSALTQNSFSNCGWLVVWILSWSWFNRAETKVLFQWSAKFYNRSHKLLPKNCILKQLRLKQYSWNYPRTNNLLMLKKILRRKPNFTNTIAVLHWKLYLRKNLNSSTGYTRKCYSTTFLLWILNVTDESCER